MVPLLVAVEQDQANGLPPCRGQRIPDVAAGGAAAAVQGHIPVNGIAGGAGPVVPPGLNAVQRLIRMGNPAIPCKVPAHIFYISRPSRAAAIGLIGAGHLIIQPGGIVAVVRIVEQHNAVLGGGVGIGIQNAVICIQVIRELVFQNRILRDGFFRRAFCRWLRGFFCGCLCGGFSGCVCERLRCFCGWLCGCIFFDGSSFSGGRIYPRFRLNGGKTIGKAKWHKAEQREQHKQQCHRPAKFGNHSRNAPSLYEYVLWG